MNGSSSFWHVGAFLFEVRNPYEPVQLVRVRSRFQFGWFWFVAKSGSRYMQIDKTVGRFASSNFQFARFRLNGSGENLGHPADYNDGVCSLRLDL